VAGIISPKLFFVPTTHDARSGYFVSHPPHLQVRRNLDGIIQPLIIKDILKTNDLAGGNGRHVLSASIYASVINKGLGLLKCDNKLVLSDTFASLCVV